LDIEALLDLWTRPLPSSLEAAAEAFRRLYTDPVTINGVALRAEDLVVRAERLQAALADAEREILDICATDTKVAVAFRLSGRQVGPLATAAGVLPPTGHQISLRVIDILTLTEGRISSITMVADELAALASVGAATLLSDPRGTD
jgi:predicted ester cyclase